MSFEVLIDDSLINLVGPISFSPAGNKHVLSLMNDFQDGFWRHSEFHNFIWDNIAETSLSQRERMSLAGKSHSMLVAAAKNLRLTDAQGDISRGSELAEVVLYGIMKEYYKALPVVPKIFYKQNSQDNAKGADSVHIVVTETDFSLWFGEAKFYNNIEDARLPSIIESVGNSLASEKLRKENSIITNLSDLDLLPIDQSLRSEIKEALSPKESLDNLKSKIHVPILLLHECDITKKCKEMTPDYRSEVAEYHKDRASSYFSKQVAMIGNLFKYSEITFHIILFPVPSKPEIVNKFVDGVTYYKKQGE